MLIKVYIISKYGVNMTYISVFKVHGGYVYVYKAYIRFSDIMCNVLRYICMRILLILTVNRQS